jgi:biopolymer transport protein TolR
MLRKPQTQHGPKAEMNVVPYIDVMLVLLVIFMVTAPLLVQGVKLELPKIENEALPTDSKLQILTLSVKSDGSYFWNVGEEVNTTAQTDSAVDLKEMAQKVKQVIDARGDTQVFIRADQEASYNTVVAGIAALQKGGVTNVGLITEPPE